jgi:hypothetical protein
MKYNTFHLMNPIYGRERKFPNQLCTTMQCTISFQMSMQTIIHKGLFSMCLFQILQ